MQLSCLKAIRAVVAAALFLVVTSGAESALAQQALAQPDIDLQADGIIYAEATNPVDGSVIVGGEFTSINGQPRQNIAKINADGTLDPSWNPGANDTVYCLAVDNAGSVYAGGFFWNIGGKDRTSLAKLSGTGTGIADPDWNPSPQSWSSNCALALDNQGSIFVASHMGNIGGEARQYLAKLSTTGAGAADSAWNPKPDDEVEALAVDGNGRVFVGGRFQKIGDHTRPYLAKLYASGTGALDSAWFLFANDVVNALAVDGNGSLFVGGWFTLIGGYTIPHLAKLPTSDMSTIDSFWNPVPDASVNSIALDGNGNIFVTGLFQNVGGRARDTIAKLSATGTGAADPAWNAGAIGHGFGTPLAAVALTSAGNVITGGAVQAVDGTQRLGLAGMSGADASLLAATDSLRPGTVNAIARQADGGMIIGGRHRPICPRTIPHYVPTR